MTEPTPTYEEPWQYWKARAERMEAALRVNGLRWGHTHAEIDALIAEVPSHKRGDE